MNYSYIFLAYFALIALSLFDNGRSASYPYIIEFFNVKTSKASLIFTFGTVLGLCANLTAKYWLSFFGVVRSAFIAMICIITGAFVIYFSAKENNFTLTLIGASFGGLGMGFLSVAMNILVAEGSSDKLRKKYLSGLHGIYGLSSLSAPLMINFVQDLGFKWFDFFLMIAIFGILVLIFNFRVDDLHKENFKDVSQAKNISLKEKSIIGLFLGFYVGGEILISSRLSFYLVDYVGYTPELANKFLSIFFATLMAGRLSHAFFDIKYSSQKVIKYSLLLSIAFCALGLYVHPIFLCFLGLSMSSVFPLSIDWIKEKFPVDSHILIAFSMTSIGLVLSTLHISVGVISDYFSIRVAFFSYFIFMLISVSLFSIASKK